MCRVLGVSPSGFYAWRKRPPAARSCADAQLSLRVSKIHQRSDATYGAPRVPAELRAEGIKVGRKRVARLLKRAGLVGVSRRKWIHTTVRARSARPAPDLVERNLARPNPIACGSPTSPISRPGPGSSTSRWYSTCSAAGSWAGRWRPICAPSWCSRRSILRGGNAAPRQSSITLTRAASIPRSSSALVAAKPGCAPRWARSATASTTRCAKASSRPSNANCSRGAALRRKPRARMAVFEFIEGWYNPHRRHSALDYLSPVS